MTIEVRRRDAPRRQKFDLRPELRADGFPAFVGIPEQTQQQLSGRQKVSLGIKHFRREPRAGERPALCQVEMDAQIERDMVVAQPPPSRCRAKSAAPLPLDKTDPIFESFRGGRRVGQQRGAGQQTGVKAFNDSARDFAIEAKIVGVQDDASLAARIRHALTIIVSAIQNRSISVSVRS